MLFQPIVLMTLVPLLLLLIMPKLSDPDTRREVEAQLQMPKAETPDLSEMMTKWLSGGQGSSGGDSRRQARVTGGGPSKASRRK